MRPIDADALMDDIKRDSKKAIDDGDKVGSFWLGYIAGLVIKQPTIQPEVLACGNGELVATPEPQVGHWIPHESPDGGEQYECSECGVLWEFNDGTPEDNEAYFCPKCGEKKTTSTKQRRTEQ